LAHRQIEKSSTQASTFGGLHPSRCAVGLGKNECSARNEESPVEGLSTSYSTKCIHNATSMELTETQSYHQIPTLSFQEHRPLAWPTFKTFFPLLEAPPNLELPQNPRHSPQSTPMRSLATLLKERRPSRTSRTVLVPYLIPTNSP